MLVAERATCSYHVPSGLIRPLPIHLLQGCNATTMYMQVLARIRFAQARSGLEPSVKPGGTLTTIQPPALPTECGLSDRHQLTRPSERSDSHQDALSPAFFHTFEPGPSVTIPLSVVSLCQEGQSSIRLASHRRTVVCIAPRGISVLYPPSRTSCFPSSYIVQILL